MLTRFVNRMQTYHTHSILCCLFVRHIIKYRRRVYILHARGIILNIIHILYNIKYTAAGYDIKAA